MGSPPNDRLKYVTKIRDRKHRLTYYYFRYRREKYKLPGKPGDPKFHETYARYLAGIKSGALGRDDSVAFLKGSIGWVIEQFIASDVGLQKLKPGTQRNYRRWLDIIKAEVGRFQIRDLTPVAVRAMRDSIRVKLAGTTADMCVMVTSVLWKFASEFCHLPLGHNPTADVAKVHTDKKSHKPWPDEVIDKTLAGSDAILRLAISLLLYSGQREGDVIRMRWDDIRTYKGRDEIRVNQEKTGAKIWVPLHRELKALLDATPHVSEFILNSSWGRAFSSSQALYEKIKTALRRTGNGDYVPHGLRATAAVRLIEAGCSEDQAATITGHKNMNVLRVYLRDVNQAKLARQAIDKQELAG
jgi:integrase